MFNALSNCISLIARNIALSLNPGISARLNAEFENTHILKHSKKKIELLNWLMDLAIVTELNSETKLAMSSLKIPSRRN